MSLNLSLTIAFLILAVIGGILAFGGLTGIIASFAKISFVVFLVLFLVSLVSLPEI